MKMKTLASAAILTLAVSFISLTSQAETFQLTCEFESLDHGTALFNNCDDGGVMRLIGANNSPCRAGDALDALLLGATAGAKVTVEYEGRSRSGTGGIEFNWTVLNASVSAGTKIDTPPGCSSTHIDIYRNK